MANIILHKRNSTPGTVPTSGALSQGELAINIGDGKLYTKNSDNNIINLGVTSISGTSITPSSGNFSNYLAVNDVPVSVSGHSHESVSQSESLITTVFNETGSSIAKMTAVYINGGHGDRPTIQKAIATGDPTSAGTYGLTYETIGINQEGRVIVFGALSGVDTDQFNPSTPQGDVNGTVVYLSPTVSGGLTTTKPYAPNHIVALGVITRTHQNAGVIEVRVQNGFELDELHNVAITGATNGQFLQYNSGNELWVPSSSGNFSSLSVNNTGVSLSGHTHTSNDITNFNSSVSGLLPTISNSGDNRILTSTGSSVGIIAESNLTFNGNFLNVVGSGSFASGLNIENQTANTIASFNANKNVVSLNTSTYPSLTELSYAKGVTSSIQTQLNNKQSTLTNPVTGIGTSGYSTRWISSSQISSGIIYDTSSSIGIGTNSPERLLDVRGMAVFGDNSLGMGRMLFAEDVFGGELGFMDDGDLTLALKMTDGSFQYGGGNPGNANIIVTSAGDVGVGTSSPSTKLEVNGVLKTAGFRSYTDVISWFGKSDGTIGIAANVNPSGTWNSASAMACFQGLNDAVTSYNPICLTTQNDAQLFLNTDGNVGVGTTSPSSKLYVVGDITANGSMFADNIISFSEYSVTSLDSIVSFTNNNGDETIDVIISGSLELVRSATGGGIWNYAVEAGWSSGSSPADTEWNADGWADLSNITTRTYTTFASALNNAIGSNVVVAELIMHHIPTNRYWKMNFNTWTPSNGGGGFSYDRTEILIDTIYKYHNGNLKTNLLSASGIGIGTANPSATLDVNGTAIFGANVLGRIKFGEDTFGGELGFYDNNDNTLALRYSDGSFQYGGGSPGAANLIVTSAGYVGIGTASPIVELDVQGTNGTINSNRILTNYLQTLNDYDTSTNSDLTIGDATKLSHINWNIDQSGNSYFAGNMGLGTSTPSTKLDVNGDVNIDGNLTFDSYTESVVAIGNSSTSQTLSLTSGTVQTCTLTGNCVFTMPATTAGKSFTMFLNTGSGNYTASFSGVRWADSATPTVTILANKVDIYSFISDGSYWYGSFSQNYG